MKFSLEKTKLTDEQWIEYAYLKAGEGVHTGLIGVGGIAAGIALSALTGSGFAFIPPALIGIHTAWKRNKEMSDSQTAIQEFGCVAHELEGHTLGDYCEQFGDEIAIAQLQWAEKRGLKLTADAEAFLDFWKQNRHRLKASTPQLSPAQEQAIAAEQKEVGTNTKINAITVPSVVVDEARSQPTPPAVRSDLSSEPGVAEILEPPPVEQPLGAPDLSEYADPAERMQVLLKAMAEQGLPLGTVLNHPFVWCWGRSQSGKTTIALLLAIARMALGYKCSYFSTDDDYPRDLPWGRVEDSPKGYREAINDVRKTISSAAKGELREQSWLFDEMFAAYSDHDIKIQPLLTCVLMKGSKTKGGVIGISQADTSSAHGLKGIDTAWREERVSIQAIHEEDELGERSPTGRYLVAKGDKTEHWAIPDWMLSEVGADGNPDPAVWVLSRFPELRQQTEAIAQNQAKNDLRARLEGLLPPSSADHQPSRKERETSKPVEAPEVVREEDFQGSEEWRKYFPEAPEAVENALYRSYQSYLEKGKGKAQFISEAFGVSGGRKYQAASAYVDFLASKFGAKQ